MAQRRVADFHRRLGDVVASAQEQFGGPLHPDLPDVLRNGHAHFLREKAAEIKRAAPDLRAERLDVGRIGQMAAQDGGGPLDPLAGDPFLALAEKFLLRHGLEKDLGKQLQRLGLVPELLRRDRHRRLAQRLESDLLPRRHRADGGGGTARLISQRRSAGCSASSIEWTCVST
jgi:hypothetical protein